MTKGCVVKTEHPLHLPSVGLGYLWCLSELVIMPADQGHRRQDHRSRGEMVSAQPITLQPYVYLDQGFSIFLPMDWKLLATPDPSHKTVVKKFLSSVFLKLSTGPGSGNTVAQPLHWRQNFLIQSLYVEKTFYKYISPRHASQSILPTSWHFFSHSPFTCTLILHSPTTCQFPSSLVL